MGCLKLLLKFMMFAFNGIICLAGAAPLVLGIWMRVSPSLNLGVLGQIEDAPAELKQLMNLSYLMMAVGAVLLIVGLLGCCVLVKLTRFVLLLFFAAVLMALIAMLTGTGVILGFNPLTEELMSQVGAKAVENIKTYYGAKPEVTKLWSETMDRLGCCGVDNYRDFIGSPYYNDNLETFPAQCCPSESDQVCDSDMAYNASITGCLPRTKELFENNKHFSTLMILGIAVVEVCAMAVSMTLYCKMK